MRECIHKWCVRVCVEGAQHAYPHTLCTHPPTAHTPLSHTHLIYICTPCHTLVILHREMHTGHPLYYTPNTPLVHILLTHTLYTHPHTYYTLPHTCTPCAHTPSHTTCKHTTFVLAPLKKPSTHKLPHTHPLHTPWKTHYTHPL